ncbi:MAG: energy transducer TonB [Bacteroidetes bacterium]|nr:energy transducer TonB [Bacteroidota bacterium]
MAQQAINSNQQEVRNRIAGIVGTILFSVALFLIMKYTFLRTPIPPFPENLSGGMEIEVNLGNSEEGMGNVQPDQPKVVVAKTIKQVVVSTPQPKVKATKFVGEDILADERGEQTKIRAVEKAISKPIVTKPVDVINPNALYKKPVRNGGSEGITGRPGDQGVAGGTAGAKLYKGVPGSGNGGQGNGTGGGVGSGVNSGISYDLSGRTSRSLPKPSYNSVEQGRVVVSIWVNREGRVTRVSAGAKGTTVTDSGLIRQAESAARQALFSANPDGPEEQNGKIIYNFIKLN